MVSTLKWRANHDGTVTGRDLLAKTAQPFAGSQIEISGAFCHGISGWRRRAVGTKSLRQASAYPSELYALLQKSDTLTQPEGEVDLLPMEEGEDEGNDSHVRRDYILR